MRINSEHPDWPEAMATVLSCTYTARAGRAIAFGMPSSKHFRIRYNFWVEGELHVGEMYTNKPMPQGSLFPMRYDPSDPQMTLHMERSGPTTPDWTPRFAIAALVGFFAGLLTLPIACSGFVLWNEHRTGDVESGGPESILGGAVVGALVGLSLMLLIWRKSRPR